jgi:talin
LKPSGNKLLPIDLRSSWQDYLPPEYVLSYKKIEKEILAEYKGLAGLSEVNAKYRYLQQAKSLKTYGYSFFVVEVSLQCQFI